MKLYVAFKGTETPIIGQKTGDFLCKCMMVHMEYDPQRRKMMVKLLPMQPTVLLKKKHCIEGVSDFDKIIPIDISIEKFDKIVDIEMLDIGKFLKDNYSKVVNNKTGKQIITGG